ncbi:hypothetical protein SAMN05216267_1001224 [Actinacidiphila rubida]|uniref:Integral membrane protein n=2 Tax=Actinacidiphila rubida TaxID=310780 RepID=A0A1H8DPN9_9ACTN|nr:hypothetical protein [Actinacidiphila rubida]SEN09173.1 hypothetical protein SAMN05216267_1001224 [Actinacidiphila rubida]
MATRADRFPPDDDPEGSEPEGSEAEDGDSQEGKPLAEDERAELASLRKRVTPRHRWRSFFSAVLITVAAVLVPLSAVAVWVADLMADTDRYVATVAPLARHPDVQAAVTDRVTEAVMAHVDINSLLSNVTPSDRPRLESALGNLRGPITSGIGDFVHQTVANFVATDAFAQLWTQLNRQAHTAFTGALTGENNTAVKVRGDAVVLDLAPVVDQVKARLANRGLGVVAHIPTVHTDYTLVKSQDVKNARTGFRLLQIIGNWLPVIAVVLAAGGVLLAVRRRRALVTAALAFAVGAVLLGIALTVFRVVYLNHLPANTNERAAGAIYDQLVRFLRLSVRTVIVLGVVVALGAWVSGPGRWALKVRDVWESGIGAVRQGLGITTLGPVGPWVHRYRYALRWAVVVVAAIVMLVWSYPTGLVVFWIALVAVAALAIIEFLDDTRQPRATRVTSP